MSQITTNNRLKHLNLDHKKGDHLLLGESIKIMAYKHFSICDY